MVHQYQVAGPNLLEAHPERVDPELIGVLGVPCGDVAGRAFLEPEPAEEPECRGQPLLAVQALLRGGSLHERVMRDAVAHFRPSSLRTQFKMLSFRHACPLIAPSPAATRSVTARLRLSPGS